MDFLREQLARFTYKPGWSFELIEDRWSPFLVKLMIKVSGAQDAYDPSRTVILCSTHGVPPDLLNHGPDQERAFAEWLQSVVLTRETHESREWLRRDGEIYNDPHKGER